MLQSHHFLKEAILKFKMKSRCHFGIHMHTFAEFTATFALTALASNPSNSWGNERAFQSAQDFKPLPEQLMQEKTFHTHPCLFISLVVDVLTTFLHLYMVMAVVLGIFINLWSVWMGQTFHVHRDHIMPFRRHKAESQSHDPSSVRTSYLPSASSVPIQLQSNPCIPKEVPYVRKHPGPSRNW